jgi:hypothetical protein
MRESGWALAPVRQPAQPTIFRWPQGRSEVELFHEFFHISGRSSCRKIELARYVIDRHSARNSCGEYFEVPEKIPGVLRGNLPYQLPVSKCIGDAMAGSSAPLP